MKSKKSFRWKNTTVVPVIMGLALVLLVLQVVFSQVPFSPTISEPLNESWRWRHIEALSAKGVRCMVDDHNGHMWFGLDRGVMKFDGYNWEHFDDPPFMDKPVHILLKTKAGTLIAGSESGLLSFDGKQWTRIFPTLPGVHLAISDIAETPNGTLLAGTQDGIIAVYNNKISLYTVLSKVEPLQQTHGHINLIILPDEILFNRNFGRIDDIFIHSNELIWLFMSRANSGKLLQFNLQDTANQVLQRFTITQELGGHTLPNRNSLLETRAGERWLISSFYKSGVLRHRNNRWEEIRLSALFGGDELHTDIVELSDGSIWIGGLERIFVYRNGQWRVFSSPSAPVPSSRIIFHQSNDGQIWVAGVQGDVYRLAYDTQQWVKYKGLNFQLKGADNREWFLSVDGRVVYKEFDSWFAFGPESGLIDAPVRIVEVPGGRIWAAGSHRGVAATAYLENNRWVMQLHPRLSWSIDPRSVFFDNQNTLWFGASVDRQEALGQVSGVLQLTNPTETVLNWKHHTQQDGITQHNVYGIGQSPDGTIWLGGSRLLHYNNRRWNHLADNELLNDYIDIVHSRRNLWVGSRYYGVFHFDGSQWKQYTTAHGLPGNTIISIFEESPNRVWTITDRGIALFDGRRWQSGLFSDYFPIPREGGEVMVDQSGNLWINKARREWKRRALPFSIITPNALEEFWTIRYTGDNNPPKTTIEVYTESVARPGNTLISWSGTDYWMETSQSQISFSYRLNDGEWSEFTSQTNVLLTNLSSGKHRFEVRARDLNFNIEPTPAFVHFSVAPPAYKQPWFLILVAGFLGVIIYLQVRLLNRNRRLNVLNLSLNSANQTLEKRKQKIEVQNQTIREQKDELEHKTQILEEQNSEILTQRDNLKEMVEKVETLSNLKQRFFTNISHEFRTPLTLILGSIEKLIAMPEKAEKERLQSTYQIIHQNSKRILRLINQILEISKIETGKMSLNPEPGNIAAFTREITRLFEEITTSRNIELSLEIDLEQPIVLFDHDMLEKILFNLISNAIKAIPAEGMILVTLSKCTSTDLEEGIAPVKTDPNGNKSEYICFTVQDTGRGIHPDKLPRIFERFYQADDRAGKPAGASSGIGLSYVRDLVLLHNGSIAAESTPGQGSIFRFEIPLQNPLPNTVMPLTGNQNLTTANISEEIRWEAKNLKLEKQFRPIPEEVDSLGIIIHNTGRSEKPLILIVEDCPELLNLISEVLDTDYEVIEARNGRIGYDIAENFQPDIIISDVMMPEMDGYALCRKLKSNLATNHIPVVLLTARVLPENKFEGYQSGADAYIEKPFSAEYLKIRVKNLLEAREMTHKKTLRDLITQPSEIEAQSADGKMLRKIQEVLEENVSNSDFDVESMSQFFFLSRCHFSRKIKQITGLSPKEIIDSYRLKRAGQLLQQKIPISEVAFLVGFDHPNSFTRAFRKFYNMTPSEFSSQN